MGLQSTSTIPPPPLLQPTDHSRLQLVWIHTSGVGSRSVHHQDLPKFVNKVLPSGVKSAQFIYSAEAKARISSDYHCIYNY